LNYASTSGHGSDEPNGSNGPAGQPLSRPDRRARDRRAGAGAPGQLSEERRRRFGHDIQHEIGTITLLASVLSSSHDVGPESRQRARQILGEIGWLDELLRAYGSGAAYVEARDGVSEPVRIDTLVSDVVLPMRLTTQTRIILNAGVAWAHVDRLPFWRVMRNLMDNAMHAAGPSGTVAVVVHTAEELVEVTIDDDGHGFGPATNRPQAQGLSIVAEFVTDWGGTFTTAQSEFGGGLVRISIPAAGDPGVELMGGGA
jgi:signal transduction histidine kinase